MPAIDHIRHLHPGVRTLAAAALICFALLAATPSALADGVSSQSDGASALPAAEVLLSGSDLLICAGQDGRDVQLRLRSDGRLLYLSDEDGQALMSRVPGTVGSGSPFLAIPLASFEGAIIVATQEGDDLLTVDLSWGDFTRPVHYHGGGQRSDPAGVGDALAFVSQRPKQSAVLGFFNEHDGTVAFDGNASVWYTGLEPITSTITVADITLNYAATAETITVANAAGAGQTQVDSTAGEIVTFNNPSASLTINAGDTGDDRIEVTGVDSAWTADISLFGQGGTDVIAFLGALDTGGGDLTALSESILLSATITASGATVDLEQESGDLSLESAIDAGTGSVWLTAAGSILDGTGAEATLITADSTALRATTGIGDAAVDASDLDIDVDHLACTTSTGDISLSDAAALTINTVDGLVGVTITTGGAGDDILIREGATSGVDDLDVDAVVSNAGAGNITLAADGNAASDDIEIRAAITASGGSIFLYSYDDVDGVGTVTVSADDRIEVYCGEVFVFGGAPTAGSADGSFEDATLFQLVTSNDSIKVSAALNITLDAVNAASGGALVILTADSDGNGSGEIIDGLSGENANITASNVALRAAEGIGDSDDLNLDVSGSVAASNGSDDIQLSNDSGSNLDIGSVAGLVGVTNTTGAITISNASPLTVTQNVSASLDVTLTANDSASSGDDLTVQSGVTVESTGQDVVLQAGDDLLLAAGSTVAGVNLVVAVDFGDADSGTGASAQFLGTLTFTGSGSIDGDADADAFTFDPVASSGTGYSFDGAGGDDVYTIQLGALGAPLSMDDQSSEGSDTLHVQGTGGADVLTVTDTGVSGGGESIGYGANLEHLRIDSLAGDDSFDVSPSTTASYALFGGDPTMPVGDQLVFQVPGGQTSIFTVSGNDGGTIATTGGYLDVVIDEFESILDAGDAPAPYPVTVAEDGARHFGDGTIRLGSAFDIELLFSHSDSANFDDLDNVDDEDGVVFNVPTLIGGAGGVVVVEVSSACLLDAWIDFDRDGSWGAGEQIFASESLSAGSDSLIFGIPAGLTPGLSFARFRVSSAGGLSPTGVAADGEVEDYAIELDVDTDRDGLGDALEGILSTNPGNQDTDGDGIDDGVEVVIGTDPLVADDLPDSDSDGIPDAFDTAPNDPDSNGDGILDGFALALNQDGSIDGPFTYADPNLDGVLDFADVRLILGVAGTGMLNGIFPYDIDLDRDGVITVADAMVLLYHLRGLVAGVPLSP